MTTRWRLDIGGVYDYTFPRNPDRYGGDSYWVRDARLTEMDIIGSSTPTIQIDGFTGAKRILRFTAITGTMMRLLQDFYLRKQSISTCRDHLYPTTPSFSCFVTSFTPILHPTTGSFPGSGEDTWDLEMTLLRLN